jgi:ABC-type multidrug transport system permease subunit
VVYGVLVALVVATCGFVPLGVLPDWIRGFSTYQPVTQLVDAVRSVLAGGSVQVSGAAWTSLAWCAALLLLLGALVLRRTRGMA